MDQESFPEIVTALEKATHDADKEVAERATLALQADVHHQMAIKMGIIEPDEIKESEPDQSGETNTRIIERNSSGFGIASFFFSILAVLSSVYLLSSYGSSYDLFHPSILCLGNPFFIFLSLLLGIFGLFAEDSEKRFAIFGIMISILCIVLYIYNTFRVFTS